MPLGIHTNDKTRLYRLGSCPKRRRATLHLRSPVCRGMVRPRGPTSRRRPEVRPKLHGCDEPSNASVPYSRSLSESFTSRNMQKERRSWGRAARAATFIEATTTSFDRKAAAQQ